ncbi:SDR family oxidoreductase [Myxococcota bacterium]|nr:SDR family oxidoreductase [Myxococcota bacterium]
MRALITGAGVRLGRATAQQLAQAGFDLVLHVHRSRDGAEEVAAQARALGRRAEILQADLSSAEGCAQLAAEALAGGPIDALVNNAALYERRALAEITLAEWERMLAVNTRAPFLLIQALAPSLAQSGLRGGGAVVNIGDIGGERPEPGFAHYSVSKAGILMLTRCLAAELAPKVRVNAVSPGAVLFPVEMPEAERDAILRTVPMAREGSAEDIAAAVVFLITQAPYVTGHTLNVDGGRLTSQLCREG